MKVAELMERSRARTVSKTKEAIAERASRSKVHTEPALRRSDGTLALAPDGLKLPLRWDFLAVNEPEQKNADSITLKFVKPAGVPWGPGMRIEFVSSCWDCMIFRLSPPRPGEDWGWLAAWFLRWFDPDDQNEKDEDGLYRVVHFISDPEPADDAMKFIVDFGSAKVDAMADLLDRMAEQGYAKCVIGDENQPSERTGPARPSSP